MRNLPALLASLALAAAAGCGPQLAADDSSVDEDGKFDGAGTSLKMPKAIVAFETQNGWGTHHVQWHTERRWDLLSPSDQQWAKSQGWLRQPVQEGQAGNGLEFLAMHRAMIEILTEQFPSQAALFDGWATPPTDPHDKANPLPNNGSTPFDANMAKAIVTIDADKFASDDDFGLFLETALRPTKTNPGNHTTDKTAGLHNYLHNRFMSSGSSIDVGDPRVNIENKLFWRLHGWIDHEWTKFRAAKGLRDDDPVYLKAIADAKMMMGMHMKGLGAGDCCCCPNDPLPPSLVATLQQE